MKDFEGIVGQPRCAVCGDVLGVATCACPRCESLYHRDCWEYNSGCAIYGCRPAARPQHEKYPPPGHPLSPLNGAIFGTLLGTGVIGLGCAVLATPSQYTMKTDLVVGAFFLACAALVGAYSGYNLPGRRSWGMILRHGLLGPGIAAGLIAWGGCFYAKGIEAVMAPMLFPLVLLYSMVMTPLALPCAYIAARFNDPELAKPYRQEVWLACALVLNLAAVVMGVVRFLV